MEDAEAAAMVVPQPCKAPTRARPYPSGGPVTVWATRVPVFEKRLAEMAVERRGLGFMRYVKAGKMGSAPAASWPIPHVLVALLRQRIANRQGHLSVLRTPATPKLAAQAQRPALHATAPFMTQQVCRELLRLNLARAARRPSDIGRVHFVHA
jgi:hypothetical protein